MSEEQTHFGYQSVRTEHKTARVASVFHSVANAYDLMNDLMSLGLQRLWKRSAITQCHLQPNDIVLDLAGGTGDLSAQMARSIKSPGHIILTDINRSMLEKAMEKLINQGITKIVKTVQANAESLPFPNAYFDKAIIGFGLRNVTHKEKALSELCRVLKPGGRLVILEFSQVHDNLKPFYDFYSFQVIPKLGEWVCQDRDSYQYLVESIRMHPNQEDLKQMILKAGFSHCRYQNLHGGIVALHSGYK